MKVTLMDIWPEPKEPKFEDSGCAHSGISGSKPIKKDVLVEMNRDIHRPIDGRDEAKD